MDKFCIKESDRKGSINRTMRFPIKLDMQIEEAIEGLNITYSKFVMLACEFALERFDKNSVPESMKYKDKPKKKKQPLK